MPPKRKTAVKRKTARKPKKKILVVNEYGTQIGTGFFSDLRKGVSNLYNKNKNKAKDYITGEVRKAVNSADTHLKKTKLISNSLNKYLPNDSFGIKNKLVSGATQAGYGQRGGAMYGRVSTYGTSYPLYGTVGML